MVLKFFNVIVTYLNQFSNFWELWDYWKQLFDIFERVGFQICITAQP
jgi:hypothetical protein